MTAAIAGIPGYSPKNLRPYWGSVAFLDWVSITFSPSSNITSTDVSSDGIPNVTLIGDETGTISLVLKSTSITNRILWGIVEDMRKNGEINAANIKFTDPSGAIPIFVTNAWIETAGETTANQDTSGADSTWVFRCQKLSYTTNKTGLPEELIKVTEDKLNNAVNFFRQLSDLI